MLRNIRERDDALPVILLTAHGSERLAVRAIKAGAYEYVKKPFDVDEMVLALERALETRALRLRNRQLHAEHAIGRRIVGDSPAMRQLLDATARVATKEITVLVRGETGTGKELIGSLLHAQSRRAAGPLVRFNCSAIPEDLAEAELFGHVRGAFTGATQARPGFFAEANHGTLVLDEIGELPLAIQAKLLRVLQEGEFEPVGSSKTRKVDVRVVVATNRDLGQAVRDGAFREDLYYRLNVVAITLPPLRDRGDDIVLLASTFAKRFAQRMGRTVEPLSQECVRRLRGYHWPGNVRELQNVIERAVITSRGGRLNLDRALPETGKGAAPAPAALTEVAIEQIHTIKELEKLERDNMVRALEATGWKVAGEKGAARLLGINPSTFASRMKALGIKRPR